MWIAIMTVVIASAIYYITIFHRHLQHSATHRIAALLRAVFLRDNSASADVIARSVTSRSVRNSLSRSRALILMTSLFIVCWYPLYTLTLIDPKFQQSTKLYKVLTLVAWSNATLNPLVLMLFDYNVGTKRPLGGCAGSKGGQIVASRELSGSWQSIYERVGSRLCSEGHSVNATGTQCANANVNGLLSPHSSVQDLAEHEQVLDDVTTHPWSRM